MRHASRFTPKRVSATRAVTRRRRATRPPSRPPALPPARPLAPAGARRRARPPHARHVPSDVRRTRARRRAQLGDEPPGRGGGGGLLRGGAACPPRAEGARAPPARDQAAAACVCAVCVSVCHTVSVSVSVSSVSEVCVCVSVSAPVSELPQNRRLGIRAHSNRQPVFKSKRPPVLKASATHKFKSSRLASWAVLRTRAIKGQAKACNFRTVSPS
jgi:hypothetical protein